MREKNLNRVLFVLVPFLFGVNGSVSVLANEPQNITIKVATQEAEIYVPEKGELFIPSALRHTPEYEIEIVAPENIKEEEVVNEEVELQPSVEKKVKVKSGDTLYSIAKSENIKVYELADYNKITSPFTVKVGQILSIPSKHSNTPVTVVKKTTNVITNLDKSKSFIEEPKLDFVEIKKGDTIYSIARKNNVPLKDLIIRNNLVPPYVLSIGQKIYIPTTAFHIVQKEDTIYSISRKYNVNLNSLVKLNNIKEPFTIILGQKLNLPASNIEVELTDNEKPVKKKEEVKVKDDDKVITEVKEASAKKTEIETEVEITSSEQLKEETKQKVEKIIIKPEPLTSKKFMWPLEGKVISEFGIKNNGKRNDGINISAPIGTKISAVENGIVAYAGNELKGLGNLLIIRHDKDYMTIYAHNDELKVKKGERVKRGDVIATVGKTGRVSTPQLHFEIRQKTKSINPISILERK